MRKLIRLLGILVIFAGVAACSKASMNYGNSPEQQRQHAKDAQDELSKDINR